MPKPTGKYKLPHPEPLDALVHARSGGIVTFMRLPHIPQPEELDVALLGIPFDGGTTYRPGARFGPRHVRQQSVLIRPWNPVLNGTDSVLLSWKSAYRTSSYLDPVVRFMRYTAMWL